VNKLYAFYGRPDDPAAFDTHYRDVHTPLVLAMPNLVGFAVSRRMAAPAAGEPEHYLIAEMTFRTGDEMQASLTSPEGEAAVADVANFATGGITVMQAEYDVVRDAQL
jgi:uncharacterized protein (TIGR02118 family)